MGLLALALENTPAFPTFPRRMSSAELSAGLVLPYAAETIAGTGGAGVGESAKYGICRRRGIQR
jgi:urea-proton symporter